MRPSARAFVGIGSNLKGPVFQVRRAIRWLRTLPESRVVCVSSLYRTSPWGVSDQPAFVNAVCELSTRLQSADLWHFLTRLEAAAGRRRRERWGPRTLDVDLLAMGNEVVDTEDLTLPHPRLAERDFVLAPWAEIAPFFDVPTFGQVRQLHASTETDEAMRRIQR